MPIDEDELILQWSELVAAHDGADTPGATFVPDIAGQTIGVDALASISLAFGLAGADDTVGATLDHNAALTVVAAQMAAGGGADVSDDGGEPFELLDEIGRGGMGVVYRARQNVLARDIALKAATLRDGRDPNVAKFLSEALVTAHLEHPNIVPVYDLSNASLEDSGSQAVLAMKLIGGVTWKALLHPQSDEDKARASDCDFDFHLQTLMSVANAVAFAHSKSILHCDIKPENVLVGDFGEVLLVDWGLAVDCSASPSPAAIAPHKSSLNTPSGTPHYMAPELAMGQSANIGPQTDVYLLGSVLHEVATGTPPHMGETTIQVVIQAARWKGLTVDEEALPPGLAPILSKALAPAPEDRYQTVAEFQQGLRDFMRHRQSLAICDDAFQHLEATNANAARVGAQNESDLYADYAEAVAGFHQALNLWAENEQARAGEIKARMAFAAAALERNDLGLAESQLGRVSEDYAPAGVLLESVRIARLTQERTRNSMRFLRYSLLGVGILMFIVLAVSYFLVADEQSQTEAALALAEEQRGVAEERLLSIRRLSDVKHLSESMSTAETLWPPLPDKVASMERWLEEADDLLSRKALHAESVQLLRDDATATETVDGARRYTFESIEEQWEHDTLAELLSGLELLSTSTVPDVRARLEFARTIATRSLTDHAAAWDAAAKAVANDPRFAGVTLVPQLGLVPLGADPDTQLQEFAHLQSGEVPVRGSDGRLQLTEASGIVLVLIPGGEFQMGARVPDPRHLEGSANVDPRAKDTEGPVHNVKIAPFLMGKYELTQGQWVRLNGNNPAAYLPGTDKGGNIVDLMHPIEQVTWLEAQGSLERMDLTLPTEAQWEYSARAGTQTVYWPGNDVTDLQGTLNIADQYCQANGGPESWQYEMALNDGYVVHAPVGRFRANPFGLHDVAGNVWEWCLDRYGAYTLGLEGPAAHRAAPSDAPRVFRGGGFRANASHARSADRYSLYARDYRAYDVGLRPARALDR